MQAQALDATKPKNFKEVIARDSQPFKWAPGLVACFHLYIKCEDKDAHCTMGIFVSPCKKEITQLMLV